MTTTDDLRSGTQRPGRLGNPDATVSDDPRIDPRLRALLVSVGLGGNGEAPPVTLDDDHETRVGLSTAAEGGFEQLFTALAAGVEEPAGTTAETVVIRGVDGHDVPLHIRRPEGATGPLPALLHIHGGGMAVMNAGGPPYDHWQKMLAAAGAVVVAVDFRNTAGDRGPHPFPAGLDDCTSALHWVHEHRKQLGVDRIVVTGESGGGNLAIATVLKAKRDGQLHMVSGLYAQCPYISNQWDTYPDELPSIQENDGYFMRADFSALMASIYDGPHSRDPLAWPLHASQDELTGLPPVAISVHELDILRDEGLAFYRKLLAAGVPAVCRTVNGTTHASDVLFAGAIPEIAAATVADILHFARRV